MNVFYSATTNSFYTTEINGDNMPDDVVELTAERHAELMNDVANGLMITHDDRGNPMSAPYPAPTNEQLKSVCKQKAKTRLENTDYTQQADVRAALENVAEFDAYRAIIRNLFTKPVPNPTWPDEPQAVWKE